MGSSTANPEPLSPVRLAATGETVGTVFYQCQRCTACCRWPGQVKVDDQEIAAMAALLNLSEQQLIEEYTRLRPDRKGLRLTERADGACTFLEGDACRVNAAKPRQCAGFPNTWNFPGWRNQCEAIPMLKNPSTGKLTHLNSTHAVANQSTERPGWASG